MSEFGVHLRFVMISAQLGDQFRAVLSRVTSQRLRYDQQRIGEFRYGQLFARCLKNIKTLKTIKKA
jgi:hypothetical protein